MIIFMITFILALATIGALFALSGNMSHTLFPDQMAFAGEHLIFFIVAVIFLIFVIVTCFFTIKDHRQKEKKHDNKVKRGSE